MTWRKAILALALAPATACSSDTFAPASLVDTLRVLAVRADRPIAAPGERVHLDVLWADPRGTGRPVRFAWGTCLNPGNSEAFACGDAVSSFAEGGPALDLDVPASALDGVASAAGEIGVVFAVCAGTFAAKRTPTAPISCVDASGNAVTREGFVWGEKRIALARGVRNANPSIARVMLDGVPWNEGEAMPIAPCSATDVGDCPAGVRRRIRVEAAPGSVESYAESQEDLVAFFYVSQGKVAIDFKRAEEGAFSVDYAAIGVDPSKDVDLWIVLRDDRGGVDWVTRKASLR